MPLDEARRRFFSALETAGFFQRAPLEELDARETLGRVTAMPIYARRPVPHFSSAAMDGIVVHSNQTQNARPDQPQRLQPDRDFIYADTGDPIPSGFDAVIMIEHVKELDDGSVEITQAIESGVNARAVGEDMATGALIISPGQRITPEAIAACLNAGVLRLQIRKKPRALYIPTGSELVPSDREPGIGEYPESNSQIFSGYLKSWGAEVEVGPILKDSPDLIRKKLEEGLKEFDLVAIVGGTSKGREDFTAEIVSQLGQVLVHGVAYHPGHPILLGLAKRKPVIGLPGFPVAAWLGLMQFVQPVIERYLGLIPVRSFTICGRLAEEVRAPHGKRIFVRVRLEETTEGYRVHPLRGGASRLSSLLQADGLLIVEEACERLDAGSPVVVELLRPLAYRSP
jgi:molybdenum cofactor synthesis domain-containing protein